jgi:SAM-dependent methyltransferase
MDGTITVTRSTREDDMTTPTTDTAQPSHNKLAVWESWWAAVDGAPGEIVWDADEADLALDLEVFAGAFNGGVPVIDLGCGDGRQTRFLARHFETVVGVDFSPAAVERARAAENPPNISYRVLDASSPEQAVQLHGEVGDANVYVRGVIQALPAASRPRAVETITRLMGERGTLFAKELPPEASFYFAALVERYGLWPELERLMQLIPPGQITEAELVRLFPADRFEVLGAGTSRIHTVNALPNGEVIVVPAIYALVRPRHTHLLSA